MPKDLGKLIGSILICQAAGLLGSVFTISSIPAWYANLNKPSFSPPNWIFGPVWLTLYTLMGISLYIIISKKEKVKIKKEALTVFGIQLILNAIWTPVFFGLHNIFAGLIIICLLWLAILKTIFKFSKIDQLAAYLLYPYLLWVSFATLLNFQLWILN